MTDFDKHSFGKDMCNGNMTSDKNRGILSISYNAINQPEKITFADGKTTEYVYSYDGTKLQTIHRTTQPQTSTTTTYYKNLIYENGALKQMLVDGGYVTFSGATSVHHFYIQDHLCNIREVTAGNGTIEQVNNYYPFGLPYSDGTSQNVDLQKYKYNGKELDKTHGLNTYDYGARQYDPVLGVWDRMDPLCEKAYEVSPYVYCKDNPLNNIDKDGRWSDPLSALSYCKTTPNSSMQYNPNTKDENLRWTVNTYSQDEDGGFVITNHRGSNELEIASDMLTVVDGIGKSLEKNGGNSTFGSNFKFYWHDANERGFYGNQHVSTVRLSTLGTKINKITGPIGYVIDGYKITGGFATDIRDFQNGYTNFYNTTHATADFVGGWAGASAGFAFGAKAGAVCSAWSGIGVIPATIIGGTVFGIAGSFGGSWLGTEAVDLIYGK